MERIGFVILHYGSVAITDTCVRSLLHLQEKQKIHIVIVDNEIDKSVELRSRFAMHYAKVPQVTVLTNNGEGGFSEANNIGYEYAREHLHCDWICVLNNDIEINQKDFIQRLDDAYQKKPCHILAPDVIRQSDLMHQNPLDDQVRTADQAQATIQMNERALRHFALVYPGLYVWQKKAEHTKRKYVSSRKEGIVPFGAFLIFTPLFVEREAEAFTPQTKFFYEEYILALRCQRAGYTIIYDPDIKVLHESAGATKATYATKKKQMRFMMERTAEACRIYLAYLKEGTQ